MSQHPEDALPGEANADELIAFFEGRDPPGTVWVVEYRVPLKVGGTYRTVRAGGPGHTLGGAEGYAHREEAKAYARELRRGDRYVVQVRREGDDEATWIFENRGFRWWPMVGWIALIGLACLGLLSALDWLYRLQG